MIRKPGCPGTIARQSRSRAPERRRAYGRPKTRCARSSPVLPPRCPKCRSAAKKFAATQACRKDTTLFEVQRSGDCGSPNTDGSSNPSRSDSKVESPSSFLLRPPPTRRTRPVSTTLPDSSSRIPRVIVDRDTAVARATRAIPPRPSAFASVATHSLRDRSSSAGLSALNFSRTVVESTQDRSALNPL